MPRPGLGGTNGASRVLLIGRVERPCAAGNTSWPGNPEPSGRAFPEGLSPSSLGAGSLAGSPRVDPVSAGLPPITCTTPCGLPISACGTSRSSTPGPPRCGCPPPRFLCESTGRRLIPTASCCPDRAPVIARTCLDTARRGFSSAQASTRTPPEPALSGGVFRWRGYRYPRSCGRRKTVCPPSNRTLVDVPPSCRVEGRVHLR